MGQLAENGSLKADDLFRVVPEVGRLLLVLGPIELAIQDHYQYDEKKSIAAWDRPFGKWEFNDLHDKYEEWYLKHSRMLEQEPRLVTGFLSVGKRMLVRILEGLGDDFLQTASRLTTTRRYQLNSSHSRDLESD